MNNKVSGNREVNHNKHYLATENMEVVQHYQNYKQKHNQLTTKSQNG